MSSGFYKVTQLPCGRISIQIPVGLTAKLLLFLGLHAAPQQWGSFFFFFFLIYAGGGGLLAKSCPTLAIPSTVASQAPLSMRFPRQEQWSGLPFSFP